MINAGAKLYAVLGHPVSHSLSPTMQNAAFDDLGLNAIYLAFDVVPERLPVLLPALGEFGFAGLNLTVPLKEVAFQQLSDLDDSAMRMRSVNTIKIEDRAMRGYSTDGAGFLAALQAEFDLDVRGRSICVIRCGGARRAAIFVQWPAAKLRLLNRSAGRAERLVLKSPVCRTRPLVWRRLQCRPGRKWWTIGNNCAGHIGRVAAGRYAFGQRRRLSFRPMVLRFDLSCAGNCNDAPAAALARV